MAGRQHLPGSTSSRRHSEQVGAFESSVRKRNVSGPLRRSSRLQRLPQSDEISLHKQLSTEPLRRRSPSLQPQKTTGDVVERSALPRIRGQKRVGEAHYYNPKRHRTSRAAQLLENRTPEDPSQDNQESNPIDHWRKSGYWPQGDWSKMSTDDNPLVGCLLARKRSTGSLRRKRSDSDKDLVEQSSNTPSDQKPRETKSAPYRDGRYQTLLATKSSFMYKDSLGISESSRSMCRRLLEADQSIPDDTMFRDDLFEKTCDALQSRNEARVLQDITRLIVPSAESLAIRGDKHLCCLIESVNEGWSNSITLTPVRPQPDYAVGFRREAFTEERLRKLQPFVGDLIDQSYFMATYYLYFPFLTCEVKCGTAALDVADRQNAHSMTLAVRAIVELFRLVKLERDLDREILAFSISHDHRSVRIYGHYAVINETKTSFYRHPIRTFDFTELEGKDKWTSYKFTKSAYRIWMPAHFKRICSAIDALPADISFELSQQSELHFSDHTGLSQDLANHGFAASTNEPTSQSRDDDSQFQPPEPIETPGTSFTEPATGRPQELKRGPR